MRGVKQLNYGIADTLVSSVLEEFSFASIDFQAGWMERSRLQAWTHGGPYQSTGDTIVQLRGPFCSG
jgi:hypothetical protein